MIKWILLQTGSHILLNFHMETANNFGSGNFENLNIKNQTYKIAPVVQREQ